MKDKMKNIRLDVTLSSLVTLLIGVAFVMWPGKVATVFAQVVAVALIVMGVIVFIAKMVNGVRRIPGIMVSLMLVLLGVWIFLSPSKAASLLPMVIGVVMVVQGINNFVIGFEIVKNNGKRKGSSFLYGIITIGFGVYCICCAFSVIKAVYILIGVMLIIDGLTGMLVVGKSNKARKDIVDVEIKSERDIEDYE